MAPTQIDVILRRFDSPDQTRVMAKGRFEIVRIGGVSISPCTFWEPSTTRSSVAALRPTLVSPVASAELRLESVPAVRAEFVLAPIAPVLSGLDCSPTDAALELCAPSGPDSN